MIISHQSINKTTNYYLLIMTRSFSNPFAKFVKKKINFFYKIFKKNIKTFKLNYILSQIFSFNLFFILNLYFNEIQLRKETTMREIQQSQCQSQQNLTVRESSKEMLTEEHQQGQQ